MSIFEDDITENILGDQFNNNIHEDLPSGDDGENNSDEEKHKDVAPIKVEPKKRSVQNPRHRLTIDTLKGERGIHSLENYYKTIKYHGKGHEKQDLNEIIKRMQHWAHRMYSNYKLDDILLNIERLGKKKPIQMHMNAYRQGMLDTRKEDNIQEENDDEEMLPTQDEPFDEFDALIGEQIAISKLAPHTPGPSRLNTSVESSIMTTPKFHTGNAIASTPFPDKFIEYSTPTKSTSPPPPTKLNSEQIARIAENRRLAQERLRAKKQQTTILEEIPEI